MLVTGGIGRVFLLVSQGYRVSGVHFVGVVVVIGRQVLNWRQTARKSSCVCEESKRTHKSRQRKRETQNAIHIPIHVKVLVRWPLRCVQNITVSICLLLRLRFIEL